VKGIIELVKLTFQYFSNSKTLIPSGTCIMAEKQHVLGKRKRSLQSLEHDGLLGSSNKKRMSGVDSGSLHFLSTM
jgi:hypothetical protein